MSVTGEVSGKSKLADGTGAIIIALVYAIAGPIVGLLLVALIAALATAELTEDTLPASLFVVAATFPISLPLSYYFAGALALVTGVIVAVAAHRRGWVPIGTAAAVPAAVFVGFAVLHRFVHVEIPGTAILRGGGESSTALWLVVCIAASLVCWLATLPVQRRMR